ncbi:MAG TPA: SRPBCC family protein [Polyangiaceae bacterium]|nr:SRPBCC family protein [Polyangiaceae bacterium]
MAKVYEKQQLRASVDDVWSAIGGFNDLPQWHPAVTGSTLEDGGRVRRLRLANGASLVERLRTFSERDRTYGYSIEQGPLPVSAYLSELRVSEPEGGSGCKVEWSGEFAPEGVAEAEAVTIIAGIYRAGLDLLRERFGS